MKMMMKNKKRYMVLCLLAFLVLACKTPELLESEKVELPGTFASGTDTATIAHLSWSDFFPDKYLLSYIDTALLNNHDLRKALERVSIARQQVRIRKGALLPQVGAGLDAGLQRFGEYTMDGVGNATTNTPDLAKDKHIPDPYPNFNLGINFQWEADIWGKLNDRKKASMQRWMSSVESVRLSRTLLVCEVANIYYTLIGLDKKKEVLEAAIHKNHESLHLAKELMAEGEISSLPVDQFRSRRLKLKEMFVETVQDIEECEHAFAVLLGKLPFKVERSDFIEITYCKFPAEVGVPAQLLRNRPDICGAEMELMATKFDASAARKALFPSLVLGGSGGFNAFNVSKWFVSPASMVYDLAAGITSYIFKGGEMRSLWEQAKANQRISLINYQETVLKSYVEVLDLVAASGKITQRKDLKTEESTIHHRSIYTANELFKTGFADYLDVLSADERYLDCELERIALNVEYCKLHTQLYRALGGGKF